MKQYKEKENLKNAIQRLEEIVRELSDGSTDIETSLKKFKEGVALVKACKAELKEAENEFVKLKAELEE
jgi:exodeoxyribonuclease VII small subunit